MTHKPWLSLLQLAGQQTLLTRYVLDHAGSLSHTLSQVRRRDKDTCVTLSLEEGSYVRTNSAHIFKRALAVEDADKVC
jgi:hypothetical protein